MKHAPSAAGHHSSLTIRLTKNTEALNPKLLPSNARNSRERVSLVAIPASLGGGRAWCGNTRVFRIGLDPGNMERWARLGRRDTANPRYYVALTVRTDWESLWRED